MTTNHDPILSQLRQINHQRECGEITRQQYDNLMDVLAHTAGAPRPRCTTDRCPPVSGCLR